MGVHMYRAVNRNEYQVSHNINTRSRSNAVPEYQRLEVCQRAVSFAGPKIWNTIPLSIRNSSSLNLFKTAFKSYLLSSYI